MILHDSPSPAVEYKTSQIKVLIEKESTLSGQIKFKGGAVKETVMYNNTSLMRHS